MPNRPSNLPPPLPPAMPPMPPPLPPAAARVAPRLAHPQHRGFLYDADCPSCPLNCSPRVPPSGSLTPRLILIGEEPGPQEILPRKEQDRRPFIGASGALLWSMLETLGCSREECWVTNAACCRAKKVKLHSQFWMQLFDVKKAAASHCHHRLLWELEYVLAGNPRATIVPLGDYALWATTHLLVPRIYSYRGSIMELDLAKLKRQPPVPTVRARK